MVAHGRCCLGNQTVGSNPTLSAIMSILPQGFRPMNSHSIFPQSVWWVVTQTLTP